MTSHRDRNEPDHTDELDDLLRWALHDSTSQCQPPGYVWERIESVIQRQLVREGRRTAGAVWRGIGRHVRRLMDLHTGQYVSRGSPYQPMILFSGWEDYVPFSLGCIVEQEMPIMRLGWAT